MTTNTTERKTAGRTRSARWLPAIVAAVVVGQGAGPAEAAAVLGMGTWDTTLLARDIRGQEVALMDPAAAFFYDTQTGLTWLADFQVGIGDHFPGSFRSNGASGLQAGTYYRTRTLSIGGVTDWRTPMAWSGGRCLDAFHVAAPELDFLQSCSEFLGSNGGGLAQEFDHLFQTVLGNVPTQGGSSAEPGYNTGPFRNLLAGLDLGNGTVLSGTLYLAGLVTGPSDPSSPFGIDGYNSATSSFSMASGRQFWDGSDNLGGVSYTLVRSGDVLRTRAVPEPSGWLLCALGLAAIPAARRWRKPGSQQRS